MLSPAIESCRHMLCPDKLGTHSDGLDIPVSGIEVVSYGGERAVEAPLGSARPEGRNILFRVV